MATNVTSTLIFEPFNSNKDEIENYIERFEATMTVRQVNDDKQKVATFISVMGAELYKLLKNLLSPDKPTEASFQTVTDKLKGHLAPKPLIIAETYKFNCRKQKEGEKVTAVVLEKGRGMGRRKECHGCTIAVAEWPRVSRVWLNQGRKV